MVLALTTVPTSSTNFLKGAATKDQRRTNNYIDADHDHLRKKARSSLSGPASPISIADLVSVVPPSVSTTPQQEVDATKDEQPKTGPTGRWSLDEKLLFLYGLSLFGKGRWKKIHLYVPDRSLVQIKSHAQKVLKRVDAGENVFQRLEENRQRVKVLVAEANRKIAAKEALLTQAQQKKKRKRASTTNITPVVVAPTRKPESMKLTTPTTTPTPTTTVTAAPAPAPSPSIGGTVTPPLVSSPWDIIHRQSSISQSRSRRAQDAPCSPTPAIACAPFPSADPPGVHASSSDDESDSSSAAGSSGVTTPKENAGGTSQNGVPSNGSGAVIAAVAALCQLSARDP